MNRHPKWISKAAALAIHESLLAEHGGLDGLIDEGRLEAALASPPNHFAYEKSDLFSLAAAYANAISRDHPFRDGNKRVALTLAGVFLELNGYTLVAPEAEAFAATIALSTQELSEGDFAEWLRRSTVKKTASRQSPRRNKKPTKAPPGRRTQRKQAPKR